MVTPGPTTAPRLVPRWYVATVVAVLAAATALFVGLALTTHGLLGWSVRGLAAAFGLLLVSAVSALARPRRRRVLEPTADGSRVFLAPALTTFPLLGAWGALLVVAVLWTVVALTDLGSVESPGFVLLTVGGALASLPDLLRLLTGRLHRWRLEIGPGGVTYRGYRTDETWPWPRIHGARIQQRGPAGVLIDVKGTGKDPVVPITAFTVPAEQLVEEIERGRTAARR